MGKLVTKHNRVWVVESSGDGVWWYPTGFMSATRPEAEYRLNERMEKYPEDHWRVTCYWAKPYQIDTTGRTKDGVLKLRKGKD